jgi:hypothetical protein
MRKAIIPLIIGILLAGFGAYSYLIPRRHFRPGNYTMPSNFTAYQGEAHYGGFHLLRLLPLALLVVGIILIIASIISLSRKT